MITTGQNNLLAFAYLQLTVNEFGHVCRQADIDQDDAYCEECEIDRPYCLCSPEQWV